MKIDLIVSRHAAAADFVATQLTGFDRVRVEMLWDERGGAVVCEVHELDHGGQHRVHTVIPVRSSATAEDVRGKVVAGNLPLHLAAEAKIVIAIEFSGPPPRGKELSLADMREAGARLHAYSVRSLETDEAVGTGVPTGKMIG